MSLKALLFLVYITDISKYLLNLTGLAQIDDSALSFHAANQEFKYDLAVFLSWVLAPRFLKKLIFNSAEHVI